MEIILLYFFIGWIIGNSLYKKSSSMAIVKTNYLLNPTLSQKDKQNMANLEAELIMRHHSNQYKVETQVQKLEKILKDSVRFGNC